MDIASLGLEIRSDGVVVASDRLNKFGQDAARAERATDQLSNAFRRFAPIVGTVMAAFSARAMKDYADSWSDMQSRVGAAVKNMEAAPALMERLVDVANASYSPLNQTVEIYGRNVAVLRDLGRNAVEAADFTEAPNHALVLTATRGDRAASVQNALSKAMAVGKLQADGLETVLANGGEVAQVLADKLGTTVSGLRGMASQGKITGDVIASALIGRLEDLRERAGEMPATMEDAAVRFGTVFGALVGRVDQATGSSEQLALKFIGLADAIRAGTDDVVRAALVIQMGLGAAMEWASNAASALGGSFDSASAMIIAGAGAAGFAVTTLTAAISMGLVKAVASLSLALLANPFALFIGGISAAVTASYLFRDEIAEIVGVDVFDVFKDTANTIINMMVGAYKAVVAVWELLPGQFSRIGKLAANALLDALGSIELSWTNPFTGTTYELFNFDLSDLKLKVDEAESYVASVAGAAYRAEQGIDRVGQAAAGLGETWRSVDGAVAAFDDLAGSATKAGEAIDEKAAKAARKLAEAYKRIVDGAQDFIASQHLEANLIGMSEQAANALRYEFDLLNEARRAGITLTDEDRWGFKALAEAMAEAEEYTRRLTEQFEFMKDVTKGIFMDIKNDLISNMSQGMSFWESAWRAMANAALNALNKVVDKLLNDVINAIFKVGSAGSGSGLFGFLGKLFGLGGGSSPYRAFSETGLYLFDNGGWTGNGPVGAAAGIVHGQEFVVKAGPAAQNRQLLEAMNAGLPLGANDNLGMAGIDGVSRAAAALVGAVGIATVAMAGFGHTTSAMAAGLNAAAYQRAPIVRSHEAHIPSAGRYGPGPQRQAGPREVSFNMAVTVSGNGDKELEARLQKATEIQMNEAITVFRREVLPYDVDRIANDPYARG